MLKHEHPHQKKPPPHFLIKNVICCLSLLLFLALPVQSQTPVPTVPPRLTNPTVMAPCGLPASQAEFTSASTITRFNMTADCIFNSWSVTATGNFLVFSSGTFTIDGNGYSIIGPSNATAINIGGSSTVLNLNNIVIRQAGGQSSEAIVVANGARLNGRNIVFRDNTGEHILRVRDGSQAQLENMWFVNNHNTANHVNNGSALTLTGGFVGSPTVNITNAIFQGNTGAPNAAASNGGNALEFNGCLTFSGNLQADGVTAATNHAGTNITDSNTGACPAAGFSYWLALTPAPTTESQNRAKKKAEKFPTATATPRPAAVTCPTLSQFGIAVHATYGLTSGVQCQRLGGGGIGIQSIVEAGFIEAVDIWGYVEQGVEVCFPQIGRVIFLDASAMPRAIVPLEATVRNGTTCASINSPGSLVLLPN